MENQIDEKPKQTEVPAPPPIIMSIPAWKVWRRGERHDYSDLVFVEHILQARERALRSAINGIIDLQSNLGGLYLPDDQVFALAATDLFVEKAQRVLTRRSRGLYWSGIFTTLLVFGVLGISIYVVYLQVSKPIPSEVLTSWPALILRIFQSIALSAFVLITLKWLLSLTRSFFHEALRLLDRRHALRYGRLYVYLRKGKVEDQQLADAFQWNMETRTSFLDIKPEVVSETLFHKFFEMIGKLPPDAIKALAESRKR